MQHRRCHPGTRYEEQSRRIFRFQDGRKRPGRQCGQNSAACTIGLLTQQSEHLSPYNLKTTEKDISMIRRSSFSPVFILTALLVQGDAFADAGNPLYLLTELPGASDYAGEWAWWDGSGGAAYDINNKGQIVGSAPLRVKQNGCSLPAIYQDGRLTAVVDYDVLERPPKPKPSEHIISWQYSRCPYVLVSSINDLGQVAGAAAKVEFHYSYDPDEDILYTIYEAYSHAFIFQDGMPTDLGSLSGRHSWSAAINSGGQVGGSAEIKVHDAFGYDYYYERAFLHGGGAMTSLGLPATANVDGRSSVTGLNDHAQMTGYWSNANSPSRGFLYQDGAMIDLGTLGGASARPYGINNNGQIVGRSTNEDDVDRAFLYQNGNMVDLGTFGGSTSIAFDINSHGDIVGFSDIFPSISWGRVSIYSLGFLYKDGAMIDLNSLIAPSSSWIIIEGKAINDFGQVVALGIRGRKDRLVLLTPIDQALKVDAPHGGEVWNTEDTVQIKWSTKGVVAKFVSIHLSLDGGITWKKLKGKGRNTGVFDWKIPKSYATSQGLIKICTFKSPKMHPKSLCKISDAEFSIQ